MARRKSRQAKQREARLQKLRAKYVTPFQDDDQPQLSGDDTGGPVDLFEPEMDAPTACESSFREEEGEEPAPKPVVAPRVRGAEVIRDAIWQEDEEVDWTGQEPEKRLLSADQLGTFFVGLQARREVPKQVMADVISFMRDNKESFVAALQKDELPSFRAMRYKAIKELPTVKLDVCTETASGEEVMFMGIGTYPRKEIRDRKLQVKYTLYYVSLKDVLAVHEKSHPNKIIGWDIDLSSDGVPESRSSGLSLDIVSVRFHGCRNIHAIAIFQPAKKGLKDKDRIALRHFLDEIPETPLKVKRVIADAPKRAALQGLKTHAAKVGCPYCYAKKVDGKYPSSTFRGEPRTDSRLRREAEALVAGTDTEDRGVRAVSPLVDLPGLDLIRDVPAEAMHLINLGVVRKMISMMYKTNKTYEVSFRAADVALLNAALKEAHSLSDFSRKPRDLDVAVYKAEEYRNLVLAYWVAVLRSAPGECSKIWLLTVFIVRAAALPDKLYRKLDLDLEELLRQWYVLYEKAFKKTNCTYNTHVFSHLDEIRDVAPLDVTSALLYEDNYAIIKTNYRAGSTATGTQALTATQLAQSLGHACRRPRRITTMATSQTEDRYIYLDGGQIYFLTNTDGPQMLGRRVPSYRTTGLLPGLDFAEVLIFKVELSAMSVVEEPIDPSAVLGKAVVLNNYASVIAWNMLEI